MDKFKITMKGTKSAKVIEVIETRSVRGSGDYGDEFREVIQYWDFEGNLLAEDDPIRFTERPEDGQSDTSSRPD